MGRSMLPPSGMPTSSSRNCGGGEMANLGIEVMSELYNKGLYSSINFYFGLISLLKQVADVHTVMNKVPASLVDHLVDIATRHGDSGGNDADLQELSLSRQIVEWSQTLLRT